MRQTSGEVSDNYPNKKLFIIVVLQQVWKVLRELYVLKSVMYVFGKFYNQSVVSLCNN